MTAADDASLDALNKALMPGPNYHTQRILPDWVIIIIDLSYKGVTKHLLWQKHESKHSAFVIPRKSRLVILDFETTIEC